MVNNYSEHILKTCIYLPFISMIHFDSREISRELKGLTLTATLTEDMVTNITV